MPTLQGTPRPTDRCRWRPSACRTSSQGTTWCSPRGAASRRCRGSGAGFSPPPRADRRPRVLRVRFHPRIHDPHQLRPVLPSLGGRLVGDERLIHVGTGVAHRERQRVLGGSRPGGGIPAETFHGAVVDEVAALSVPGISKPALAAPRGACGTRTDSCPLAMRGRMAERCSSLPKRSSWNSTTATTVLRVSDDSNSGRSHGVTLA